MRPETVQALGEVQAGTMVVTLELGELALPSSLALLASLTFTRAGASLQTQPRQLLHQKQLSRVSHE